MSGLHKVLNKIFHDRCLIVHIKKTQCYLKYINNLFKINEAFRSLLHPQGKIIKERS